MGQLVLGGFVLVSVVAAFWLMARMSPRAASVTDKSLAAIETERPLARGLWFNALFTAYAVFELGAAAGRGDGGWVWVWLLPVTMSGGLTILQYQAVANSHPETAISTFWRRWQRALDPLPALGFIGAITIPGFGVGSAWHWVGVGALALVASSILSRVVSTLRQRPARA